MSATIDRTPRTCSQCGLQWVGVHMCIPALQSEIERLQGELEGARRDAERYRWLRNRAWPFEFKGENSSDADAAIDLARSKGVAK